jgi:hypothetical protein
VLLAADAVDDIGVHTVVFWVDGDYLATDTTAPYHAVLPTELLSDGDHTLMAAAYDLVGKEGFATAVTVSVHNQDGEGNARYNPALRVPSCLILGSVCDSGDLLLGRGENAGPDGGPEPNQPNTIHDSCPDGHYGVWHSGEQQDRISVYTQDGSPFVPGSQVVLEVTVYPDWTDYDEDYLDVYYTADANNPDWTYITTVQPNDWDDRLHTFEYTLPEGNLQAVRGVFRWESYQGACEPFGWTDHDDVVFAVGSTEDVAPPTVRITSPQAGDIVSGSVWIEALAVDDLHITHVEFSVGGDVLGVDTTAPYGMNWNTVVAGPGTHELTVKAFDAAGNESTGLGIVVTVQ